MTKDNGTVTAVMLAIESEDDLRDKAIAVLDLLSERITLRKVTEIIANRMHRSQNVSDWPEDEQDEWDRLSTAPGTRPGHMTAENRRKVMAEYRARRVALDLLQLEPVGWMATLSYAATALESSSDNGDRYCAQQIRSYIDQAKS